MGGLVIFDFKSRNAGIYADIGQAGRFIQRRILEPTHIGAADAGNASDILQTSLDSLKSSKSGFEIDIGMIRTSKLDILRKGIDLDYGVVIQDLIGALGGYVKPNIRAGAMAHILFIDSKFFPRCDVGIEFIDMINRQGVDFFQRINMGAEVNMLFDVLKLRGGFHQGYPRYGAGLDFHILMLDYAYFTRELGAKPGQFPENTHRVQISFGI